ncbi:hypothetical protein C9439_00850 [archaeon SCG-AAA382B04]|nr:hypothetical protein C9439_00850 [archaeon SCG-AAA382B04]
MVKRRDFLKNILAGGMIAGTAGAAGLIIKAGDEIEKVIAAVPAANGYLLIDTKKCSGCMSCMLACSLVHEGEENLSLARLQISQNNFERFPQDISQDQCRQCTSPACVEACPTDAMHVDEENGNIRVVDEDRCIGCKRCVEACRYTPSRVIWNFKNNTSQR